MKRIVALIMSLCMLVIITTACTQTATTTTTTTTTAATTAATTTAAATTADDGTVWKEFDNVVLTCFINLSWFLIDKFAGHIPDQITKDTGISLDLTIAIDGGQLGLMIASGELPDMIYTDTYFDELSDAGLCYDYDSLIDEYDVGWEIDPVRRGNALLTSKDGKIYYVRNHFATDEDWKNAPIAAPMTGSISVRFDILEQFGNPKLETNADFEAVLAKVKKDTELYGHVTGLGGFEIWRTSCGVTNCDWIKQDDGTYNHYINTPRMKELLRMMNRWIREGYMPKDCFVSVETKVGWDMYETGKAFSVTSATQNGGPESALKIAAIDPKWISGDIAPLDYDDVWVSSVGWCGTFISRNCSNPEAAINYMEYMFTPYAQYLTQMGREGIDYVMGENGIPQFSDEWKAAAADGSYSEVYNPWMYFGGHPIVEGVARCAAYPFYMEQFEPAYKVLRENFKNFPWIVAATPKTDTDERNMLNKIKDLIYGHEASCILASSESAFEAEYQKFIDNMKEIGLDELEAYMSQKIPEMEKLYK